MSEMSDMICDGPNNAVNAVSSSSSAVAMTQDIPQAQNSNAFVTVMTSDDKQFQVPIAIATKSKTLKNMLDDMGLLEQNAKIDDSMVFPLPNVGSSIYQLVLKYCQHHYDNPTPPRSSDDAAPRTAASYAEITGEFDLEFVKVDTATLFDLVCAANYLDCKPLLDLCCKAVAMQIKGKTAEQIRQAFNIANDFTPEEEAMTRRENEWAPEEVDAEAGTSTQATSAQEQTTAATTSVQ
jgi:S-phase kinase-associated protein 1